VRTVKDSNSGSPPKVRRGYYIHFYQAMEYTENPQYSPHPFEGVPGAAAYLILT